MTPTEDLKAELLGRLPRTGEAMGNYALIRELGWPDDQYWKIRSHLIEEGRVERGRGRGGSVRLVLATDAEDLAGGTEATVVGEAALVSLGELELYEPMRDVIATAWAKDRLADPLCVIDTSRQGRRSTGGRWSRPDIVSVEVKTYLHLPQGKYIEVTTFEVKPVDAVDVAAVYEALSHRRSATHSYVLLHIPDDRLDSLREVLDDVRRVAREHGVGVIVAGEPSDYTTWDELEEAQRHEPDPSRLEAFLVTQLPEEYGEKIALAVR